MSETSVTGTDRDMAAGIITHHLTGIERELLAMGIAVSELHFEATGSGHGAPFSWKATRTTDRGNLPWPEMTDENVAAARRHAGQIIASHLRGITAGLAGMGVTVTGMRFTAAGTGHDVPFRWSGTGHDVPFHWSENLEWDAAGKGHAVYPIACQRADCVHNDQPWAHSRPPE